MQKTHKMALAAFSCVFSINGWVPGKALPLTIVAIITKVDAYPAHGTEQDLCACPAICSLVARYMSTCDTP